MKTTDLITEVRSWIGTPFHHQAQLKGVGCDCIGLITGAAAALNSPVDRPVNYATRPDPQMLLSAIIDSGVGIEVPIKDLSIGDVMVFRIHKTPAHFGILVSDGVMIHCDERYGTVEVSIGDKWSSRIVKVYRFKNIEEDA